MNKRKYLVYKITNRFNNKIYIGVHSTLNESDRYMGSGVEIKEALKKEGRKSFIKEILFIFDTKEEMLNKEKELVTKEFCMDANTYNRIEGGGTHLTLDMIPCDDKNGGCILLYKEDPRWLSGEYQHIAKGQKNEKGWILTKDKNNNFFRIKKDDIRDTSGELIPFSKGGVVKGFEVKKCTQEHKQKIGLANSEKQKGQANSQFGTCWVTKAGINKKIKKENFDEYINQGWIKGRNMK